MNRMLCLLMITVGMLTGLFLDTGFAARITVHTHPDHFAVYSPIVFDARSEGEENLAGVRWDFDDGTVVHGPLAEHRFKEPGPHYVQLETIDPHGNRTYDVIQLDVAAEPIGVDLRVSGIRVFDPFPTGNNDGVLSPGERGFAQIVITNIGTKSAPNVKATLELTPKIREQLPRQYHRQTLSFGAIAPFRHVSSGNTLVFPLRYNCEAPYGLWFYLLIEDDEQHRSLGALTIPLGDRESNVYSVPFGVEGLITSTLRESTLYFRSPATDLLRVSVTSTSVLDPAVTLFSPDGNQLTNKNSGDGDDELTILADAPEGLYRMMIGGKSGSIGSYIVTVDTGYVPAGHEQSNITMGEDRIGRIRTAGETRVYTFYASRNERIEALVTSEEDKLDPFLTLFDPNGNAIEYDDDSGPGTDAHILVPHVPSSGMFRLIVKSSPKSPTTGRFRLILIDERREVDEVSAGQTSTGVIQNMGHRVLYHFKNPNRRLLVFTLDDLETGPEEYSTFDPYLRLLDAAECLVAVDDNSGAGDDAMLMTRLSEGTVEVSGGPYETTGSYRLRVEQDAKATPSLRFGTTTTLISSGRTDSYRTYVEEGGSIHVEVTRISQDLEPVVRLLAPNGRQLLQAQPDESTQGDNVRVFLIAPQTGQYRIQVWGVGRTSGLAAIKLEVID